MRKLHVIAVAVALAGLVSANASAEESSDLEISGNVTTLAGWQRAQGGAARQNPTRGGLLGDGLGFYGANGTDTFNFFIDQVEVDLAKSFGENIRVRADLDFSPHRSDAGAVYLEQGYVTANIPAGNGWELLVGRFNSGIGLDPVDRNELKTISFSTPHRVLLPSNLTGARLGYDWSENTRWELFVVNNLGDVIAGNSSLPSYGFNLSHNWGEEGQKHWVKLSGAGGSEKATKKGFTFLGDLSASLAATDALRIGLEGIYRQDNMGPGNAQFIAGQLNGTYAFSDVWDGTLRYDYVWDLDSGQVGSPVGQTVNAIIAGVPGLGYAGQNHEVTIATGYQITDGARFVMEGRVDLATASAAAPTTGFGYGVGGMFAYSF